MRRVLPSVLLVAAALAMAAAPAAGGDSSGPHGKGAPPAKPPASGRDDAKDANADAARRAAIRRGVAYLVERVPKLQDSDGSPRKPFTQATTGLVLLLDEETSDARLRAQVFAVLAEDVARWVDRVAEESRDPARLPPGPGVADSRCLVQYVWPVAQAALLFSEMDARGVRRDQARAALRVCVRVLGEARCANGGWGHGRFRRDGGGTASPPTLGGVSLGGYPETLLASTNCAAIALGAARATLGKDAVPDLEPTRAYYRAAQLRNGSFPYDPSQRSADLAETNAGRSAGALVAMRCLSMPRDAAWTSAARYVDGALDLVAEAHGSPCLALFHGALAFRVMGDDAARRFRARFEGPLVRSQAEDGCLPCPCERRAFGVTCDDPRPGLPAVFEGGQRAYETALDTLTLLLMDGRPLKSVDRVEAGPAVTPVGR